MIGVVTAELDNLSNLIRFNLENNQLDELPNFSSLSPDIFSVSNNKFTFEDLEPNVSVITVNTGQQPFGEAQTYDVGLDGEQTLTFDVGGMQNNYQWTKNGENISGANEASYTFTVTSLEDLGEYKLLVANDIVIGVTLESQPITIVSSDIVTGIDDEMELAEVVVYPNPMEKTATIYAPEMESKTIDVQVYDLTGNEIPFQLNNIGNGKYALSIADDKRGMLLIRVNQGEAYVYKKIMKN